MASLKTILSKLPSAKRTAFVNNMRFANGHLININLAGMPASQKVALMQACGCTTEGYACDAYTSGSCHKSADSACDAAACKGNKGAVPVSLGIMLEAVPATPKRKYLNSIDYEGGKLISADVRLLGAGRGATGRLKKHLPSA